MCVYACTYALAQVARSQLCPFAPHRQPRRMKRPAAKLAPVRSSSELDAWVNSLQSLAVAAAKRLSVACDRDICCEYLGQRKGPAHKARYFKHPAEWRVPAGKTRNKVEVSFLWTATDFAPVLTEQRNKDARLRGIALPQNLNALAPVAPCTLWCDRALAGLNDAAKNFVDSYGPELLLEFGLQVHCAYALFH